MGGRASYDDDDQLKMMCFPDFPKMHNFMLNFKLLKSEKKKSEKSFSGIS